MTLTFNGHTTFPNNGNNEVAAYTENTSNLRFENNELLIIPVKRSSWTSARIESKRSWKCPDGKAMIFQGEIKIPDFTGSPEKYHGLWPAFWTKGQSNRDGGAGWPKCGEWDIFEVHGRMSNRQQATIHWEGSNKDKMNTGGSTTYAGNAYHTWAVKIDRRNADWKKQSITFWRDGSEYFKVTGADIDGRPNSGFDQWADLAHKNFFMILNVAVGGKGSYPGETSPTTVSGIEAAMRVKYVAVYQSN